MPIDLLRRAEVQVTVAAVGEDLLVTGRSELTLHADCPFSFRARVRSSRSSGRSRSFELALNSPGADLIRRFHLEGRIIGATARPPALLDADCSAPGTPPTGAGGRTARPCHRLGNHHRGHPDHLARAAPRLLRARSPCPCGPEAAEASANRFTRLMMKPFAAMPAANGPPPWWRFRSRTRKESGSSEVSTAELRIRPARLAQPSRVNRFCPKSPSVTNCPVL